MILRIAALLLTAHFPILQSVAFTDCCCGDACPKARAAASEPAPCCDEESEASEPSDSCTHIEPSNQACVVDAVGLSVHEAEYGSPKPLAFVDSDDARPIPEGPLQDTGPPVYLRLRALRL